jgi:ATP-binding protein involved in chromosome partitioning
MSVEREHVVDIIKQVIHPELGKNIVDAEIVKEINVNENKIHLVLSFKRKGDPLADSVRRACESMVKRSYPNAELIIDVVEAATLSSKHKEIPDMLSKVKHVILVASGKGGVGKSTIAANLAVALSLDGKKVGLLDADIYGPSIPKLFHAEDAKPSAITIDGFDAIEPIFKYGVKMLSIGFLVPPETALMWRGPMASSALKQILQETNWGELDYLIIDTPPGTSDIHLTLIQSVKISGVIIVSTPQEISVVDAVKAIEMFKNEKHAVPIYGLIENMAWFTPAELPDKKYYIFGKNGCVRLAEKYNLPLLGQIPIAESICEQGDNGNPTALDVNSIEGKAFSELAKKILIIDYKMS